MESVDVMVTARGDQLKQPWMQRLCRDFDCEIQIVKANVDIDYGWLHLKLSGPVEEIQRSIAWLMTTGMHVDSEQRAVGAS